MTKAPPINWRRWKFECDERGILLRTPFFGFMVSDKYPLKYGNETETGVTFAWWAGVYLYRGWSVRNG